MLLAALALDVTTRSLLEEMRDLDRLTRPAVYACEQYSSFDRRSAAGPDAGADWFANHDAGHYLRADDDGFVLAECEGPGAVVRIWSANPQGTLRLRLDGETVLEEDFRALLTGGVAGFPPPFAAERSRGCNLYYPFPFARSLKVSCSEGGQYFHVQVRRYPQGTGVTTWSPGERRLALPELDAGDAAGENDAGDWVDARSLEGPGVVRRLEIALPDGEQELRTRTLRIVVDGTPAVHAPLGDFFGTAPGRNPHHGMPMQVREDGTGVCRFPMPFERSFELEVDAPVRLRVERGARRPLRFFAVWNGDAALPTRPMRDWPVARVAGGAGRLVGCAMSVRNPVRAWWGEGDEKIFVDGEAFPAFFGTGTEDYFGYAWCDTALFDAPYHSQSRCDGPGNRGFTALARWHVLDDVPFTSALDFDMEVWHWVDTTLALSTMAYYYAEPAATHGLEAPPPGARAVVPLPPIPRVANAIEGETMVVAPGAAGVAEPQDLSFAEGFSGDAHLWWREAAPGDALTLRFDVPPERAGRRTLAVALTCAPDYGIVRLQLNGETLAEGVDLYAARVAPLGERRFEDVTLRAGANELTVTITGSHPDARPQNHMFGLDYVRVDD